MAVRSRIEAPHLEVLNLAHDSMGGFVAGRIEVPGAIRLLSTPGVMFLHREGFGDNGQGRVNLVHVPIARVLDVMARTSPIITIGGEDKGLPYQQEASLATVIISTQENGQRPQRSTMDILTWNAMLRAQQVYRDQSISHWPSKEVYSIDVTRDSQLRGYALRAILDFEAELVAKK